MAAALNIIFLLIANVIVGIVRLITASAHEAGAAYRLASTELARIYARKGWL